VKVDADQLSLAIGRRGQNARLTSRLIGWEVSIDGVDREATEHEKLVSKMGDAAQTLSVALGVSRDIASALVGVGMNSPELIVDATTDDLVGMLGCSPEVASQILDAAKRNSTR